MSLAVYYFVCSAISPYFFYLANKNAFKSLSHSVEECKVVIGGSILIFT